MAEPRIQHVIVLFATIMFVTAPSWCQKGAGHYRVGIGFAESSTLLYSPDAPYTAAAAKAKIKGTVLLYAIVGEDGCARNLRVENKLGYGLDKAALDAVSRWKFRKFQKPTPMHIEVNFDPTWSTEQSLKSIPVCTGQK